MLLRLQLAKSYKFKSNHDEQNEITAYFGGRLISAPGLLLGAIEGRGHILPFTLTEMLLGK